MSRVGKKPIALPDGVQATVSGQTLEVKGPKGERRFTASDEVSVSVGENMITVRPRGSTKRTRQQWGMARSMAANCVTGVTTGFRKVLEINGVGYRARLQKNTLHLSLGLSHDVEFEAPEGIVITVPANNRVVVEGIDQQQVGEVAANIRKWRKPEPFKGKGIKYADELVYRKVGKKK